jgi:hypothetical protein
VLDAWEAAGLAVRSATIAGEPFWATIEIAESADLLAASTDALRLNG